MDSTDAGRRKLTRWIWGLIVLLLLIVALLAGLWLRAGVIGEREYDAAIVELQKASAGFRSQRGRSLSSETAQRFREGREEMLRRLIRAAGGKGVPKLDDPHAVREWLDILTVRWRWEEATGKFSAADWEVTCAPIDFVISAEFDRSSEALFVIDGDFEGRPERGRVMLQCLIEREFRAGQLAPARILGSDRFARLARLAQEFDVGNEGAEARTILIQAVTRAARQATEFLSAEEVAKFFSAMEILAREFPAKHRPWLERWEAELLRSGRTWREGAAINNDPKTRNSRGPATWRGQLERPAQLRNHARAIHWLAELKIGVGAGRVPDLNARAAVVADVDFLNGVEHWAVDVQCFVWSFSEIQESATARAQVLVLGAGLAGAQQLDAVVRAAPDSLRIDPCSNEPFAVRRSGNSVVVISNGFRPAALAPIDGSERASRRWREFRSRMLEDEGPVVRWDNLPAALR